MLTNRWSQVKEDLFVYCKGGTSKEVTSTAHEGRVTSGKIEVWSLEELEMYFVLQVIIQIRSLVGCFELKAPDGSFRQVQKVWVWGYECVYDEENPNLEVGEFPSLYTFWFMPDWKATPYWGSLLTLRICQVLWGIFLFISGWCGPSFLSLSS